MIFTEPLFFGFFLLVFAMHWGLTSLHARKLWLLVSSYVFYGAWDAQFLLLIFASTLVDYIVGRVLANERPALGRRFWLVISLIANLGILGFFKYFDFFVVSGASLLGALGFDVEPRTLNWILPVGISFFTFQSMSYTIDVYRGNLKPIKSFSDFALFVSFFPQLVAGPIVRAVDFLPQLTRTCRFADVAVRPALNLFLIGFIKKACIADNLAPYADLVFEAPALYSSVAVWIGVLFYSVQIYCDFSGYSDMAIACAALLGYQLPKNFNFPYFASSIAEFWRRWHISLSTWLRDYLYISLGGRSSSRLFTWRNLMLTMLLGGLWHGAGWNWVVWGGLHGLALVVVSLVSGGRSAATKSGVAALPGMLLTFLWVCGTWVFFRAQSFEDALAALRSMAFAGDGAKALTEFGDPPLFLLLLPILAGHALLAHKPLERWGLRLSGTSYAILLALATSLALSFVSLHKQPFIYFQF